MKQFLLILGFGLLALSAGAAGVSDQRKSAQVIQPFPGRFAGPNQPMLSTPGARQPGTLGRFATGQDQNGFAGSMGGSTSGEFQGSFRTPNQNASRAFGRRTPAFDNEPIPVFPDGGTLRQFDQDFDSRRFDRNFESRRFERNTRKFNRQFNRGARSAVPGPAINAVPSPGVNAVPSPGVNAVPPPAVQGIPQPAPPDSLGQTPSPPRLTPPDIGDPPTVPPLGPLDLGDPPTVPRLTPPSIGQPGSGSQGRTPGGSSSPAPRGGAGR